jgi:hypothetical protein
MVPQEILYMLAHSTLGAYPGGKTPAPAGATQKRQQCRREEEGRSQGRHGYLSCATGPEESATMEKEERRQSEEQQEERLVGGRSADGRFGAAVCEPSDRSCRPLPGRLHRPLPLEAVDGQSIWVACPGGCFWRTRRQKKQRAVVGTRSERRRRRVNQTPSNKLGKGSNAKSKAANSNADALRAR